LDLTALKTKAESTATITSSTPNIWTDHTRPIVGNGEDHEFNEVFFDKVRVPKSNQDCEENKGWDCAKYLLEFERGGSLVAGRTRRLLLWSRS